MIFPHFNNLNNHVCLVCGDAHDAKTLLLCVDGSKQGNFETAKQIHLDCLVKLDLRIKTIDSNTFVYGRLP